MQGLLRPVPPHLGSTGSQFLFDVGADVTAPTGFYRDTNNVEQGGAGEHTTLFRESERKESGSGTLINPFFKQDKHEHTTRNKEPNHQHRYN